MNKIHCPSCNTVYRVGENAGGRRVRCQQCGSMFHVPDVPGINGPSRLQGMEPGQDLFCVKCGAAIPKTATRCRECGAAATPMSPRKDKSSLRPTVPPAPEDERRSSADGRGDEHVSSALSWPCPECGTYRPKEAVICTMCGFNRATGKRLVTDVTEPQPSEEEEQDVAIPEPKRSKPTDKTTLFLLAKWQRILLRFMLLWVTWNILYAVALFTNYPNAALIMGLAHVAVVLAVLIAAFVELRLLRVHLLFAILLSVLTPIPFLGLLVLMLIDQSVVRTLRVANLSVGFLGMSRRQMAAIYTNASIKYEDRIAYDQAESPTYRPDHKDMAVLVASALARWTTFLVIIAVGALLIVAMSGRIAWVLKEPAFESIYDRGFRSVDTSIPGRVRFPHFIESDEEVWSQIQGLSSWQRHYGLRWYVSLAPGGRHYNEARRAIAGKPSPLMAVLVLAATSVVMRFMCSRLARTIDDDFG